MQQLWIFRVISRIAPALVPGRALHRFALQAAANGSAAGAAAAFSAAAHSYRHAWDVESLARLRVHEGMVTARLGRDPALEAEMLLGIVRGLNKLDRLESLEAPFEMRDARAVLSDWLAGSETAAIVGEDQAAA